jgi:hypothetical protein
VPTYSARSRITALLFLGLIGAATAAAQVKRVAVGSLGSTPAALKMRVALIAELHKHGNLAVVTEAAGADAVITGTAEIWLRGYYSLNPRSRSITDDAHAVYGGYLSVDVRGPHSEQIWSYLAVPRRTGTDEIYRNLAEQVVKKFREAVK